MKHSSQTPVWIEPLSHREVEILRLISDGLSNGEISQKLMLSPETIKWYNKQIFSKLGVKNRTQAARKADEYGVFDSGVQVATNLPAQLIHFVGREGELLALENLIIARGNRLVTLAGPGGIGKTWVALEFSRRCLQRTALQSQGGVQPAHPFPNGIFLVSLEPIDSCELILPAIAEGMRYRLDRGEAQLFEYLRSKRLLLVIDNFEHLLDGAVILSRILQSAPGVHLLVTSRERLSLHEEQVYPLHGLNYPISEQASKVADYSAGKLFLQAARRQQPDFTMESSDVEHVASICRLVEGLPLALELAAAWTASLSLSIIAREIQRNFDFLSQELRNLPVRHRSVRAVMDVSWELLGPAERRLFSMLSVFRGGFLREAASAVAGADLHNLASLVSKSLVRYRQSNDRYDIHELLRQFAAEKATQYIEDLQELHDRHSQYYCQWFAGQVSPQTLKFAGQKAVLDALSAELENARAAWTWALNNQRMERLLSTINAMGMYYVWRGGFREGEQVFRAIVGHLVEVGEANDPHRKLMQAITINWQAFFLNELGDKKKALTLLLEGQIVLDSPGLAQLDTRKARAHHLIEITRADWSRSSAARLDLLAQAQALNRTIDHPFGLAYALNTSSRITILAGRYQEARQFLKESLSIYEDTGNQLGLAVSLTGLGNLALAQNEYGQAEQLLQRAIDIAREMDDPERITISSLYLGTVYLHSGQFPRAQHVLEKCVADALDLGLQPLQSSGLYYLGYAWLHLGEYDRAIECGKAALPLAKGTNDEEIASQSILLPAAISLAQGSFIEALNGFREAVNTQRLSRSARVVFVEGSVQIGLGTVLLQMGKMNEAVTFFSTYLEQAVDDRRQDMLLSTLAGTALLLIKQGEASRAIGLYSLAASYPFIGHSRWFSDIIGQSIEESASQLPAARGVAAGPREELPDLWGTAKDLLLEFRETTI